jgi:hypothetical protein
MGLFGKLFGFSLVMAGFIIAAYWTVWVLMLLVRTATI